MLPSAYEVPAVYVYRRGNNLWQDLQWRWGQLGWGDKTLECKEKEHARKRGLQCTGSKVGILFWVHAISDFHCLHAVNNERSLKSGNGEVETFEVFLSSTWASSVNIYIHNYMDLCSQQAFYWPLTELYPVDTHRGYPWFSWPRFSYGTNSPRLHLLDR